MALTLGTAVVTEMALGVAGEVGAGLAKVMFSFLKGQKPRNNKDLITFETRFKQITYDALNVAQESLQQCISILREEGYRKEKIRVNEMLEGVGKVRDEIRSSPITKFPSEGKGVSEVVADALRLFYTTIVYKSLAIQNKSDILFETLYSEPEDVHEKVKEEVLALHKVVQDLKTTWRLRVLGVLSEDAAQALMQTLRDQNQDLYKLLHEATGTDRDAIEAETPIVVLKKPRLFGKGQFYDALTRLIMDMVTTKQLKNVKMDTLEGMIRANYPDVKFEAKDLEQAAKKLVDKKIGYTIGEGGDGVKELHFSVI